jgi:hypothetical protein
MPLLGFSNGGKKKKKLTTTRKRKICKIVAYGCQTPSAQRRSDQKQAGVELCQANGKLWLAKQAET